MTTIFEEIRDAVEAGGPDTALATLVGEVQASPTANTVLDRLKTIATKLDSLATYVDGLEGLATSLNGYVDGLEALVGTTNSSLTTLAGYTDGLEALITTLNGYVDTLEASQTTIISALGSPMQSSGGSVNHSVTGIGDGRAFVTTAGTRVALASSTAAKFVTITAETDNTGIVVVGGSTCVAALATRRGTPLNAGESVTFPCDNLADFSSDAMVSTDGVTYTYGT